MKYYEICNNVNFEYGCRIAKELSLIGNDNSAEGFKNAGSTGEKKAAEYITNEMRKIGLCNISKHAFEVDAWEYRKSTLTYLKCGERISYPLSAFAGIKGTGREGINANIVDAGYGTYEDCKKVDLKNSIALIRVDLSKDYWLGEPVYQVELEGALAVIVIMEGQQFGNKDEVLNSGDCIARPNIPIVNISKINGERLIKDLKLQRINGILEVDCDLFKGQSQNIVGEIPGEVEDEYILLGAHYDGYFRAYLDDAFGVGAILAIAKAIKDSGYRPKYTIKIIAHGAEEFGVCNSHYDWCIGSWQQITNIEPQWSQKVKLFLNIDAAVPDANEFTVQASPQLHSFIDICLSKIHFNIQNKWENGYVIQDVNGPWSDDFSYYISGVPVIICGRGKSKWKTQFYHTNMDNCEVLNQNLMKELISVYIYLLYEYDKRKNTPLDINEEIRQFYRSIDRELMANMKINLKQFQNTIYELTGLIRQHAEDEDLLMKNTLMAKINNKLIRSIRALDFDDNIIYRLDEVQKNLSLLNKITECICEYDYESADKILHDFVEYEIIRDFEDEVYEYWCIKVLDENKGKLNWAEGLIERPIDIRLLYKLLQSRKSVEKIHKEIDILRTVEIKKSQEHIKEITKNMREIIDYIKAYTILNITSQIKVSSHKVSIREYL